MTATMPSGLAVHGATRGTSRLYQLVLDYFESGIDPRPGMTVVDVGANIGLFSLEVLQRCEGAARLVCLEPAPEPFRHLERNLAELFPAAQARAYPYAVGRRSRTAVLYYRPWASGLSSLDRRGATDERRLAAAMLRPDPPPAYRDAVPPGLRRLPRAVSRWLVEFTMRRAQHKVVPVTCTVRTLSDVIREAGLERIDILKVDVEGAELDVLLGVETGDWPKIHSVAVEVHDVDGRLRTVRDLLAARGLSRIETGQEWLFETTDVHMVFASRSPA